MTAAVREPAPRAGRVRGRDFRLLWAGETTSTLGTSVTSVALPLVAVTALDATAFQVAMLTAATWLPWLLIGLPAGAWVDRLPPRPVMITCDVISLALYGSVPLAAAAGVTVGPLPARGGARRRRGGRVLQDLLPGAAAGPRAEG